MTYAAPTIDAAGLAIAGYQDIEMYLIDLARSVYGVDIYLGNDSQDFQIIAGMAQAIHDTLLGVSKAVNDRTPRTATGAGLDSIVALNGIKRRASTKSLANLTITGTPYTVIINGVVGDASGGVWRLPSPVTIGASGTVGVAAYAEADGPVYALPSEINIILTPTFGWASVINPNAASAGRAAETDAELRGRQVEAVGIPSQSIVGGIIGAVRNLEGVLAAQIYENSTGTPQPDINGVRNADIGGFPPYSLTLVVEGGADAVVANEYDRRKTPGVYTNGTTSVTITDASGVNNTIRFFRPTLTPIKVEMTVRALSGYNNAVGDTLKQALVDRAAALVAGKNVIISELEQAALNSDPLTDPAFSLSLTRIALAADAFGALDLIMTFKQRPTLALSDISLIVI
jgi:uncharacterized phage protein gp47/JayE